MFTIRHIRTNIMHSLALTKGEVKLTNEGRTSINILAVKPQLINEFEKIKKQNLAIGAQDAILQRKIDAASNQQLNDASDWLKANAPVGGYPQFSLEHKFAQMLKIALSSRSTEAYFLPEGQKTPEKEKINEETRREMSLLKNDISLLADLNNDGTIDASLRDVVHEDVLKRALSRVTEGGKEDKIKTVYKTVTGKELSTPISTESVKEFQTKLRTSLVMIQKLTGGNAGLYGLLIGKLDPYMTQVKRLQPKPEVKVDEIQGLTPEMQNVVGALVTAGVLMITGGVVMVGRNVETVTAESVLNDLDRSIPRKVWDWIKDAFTGRRLAFTFGQDKMSVNEYKEKIRDFAQEIMSGNPKTPIAIEIYTTARKIATDLGMANDEDAIRKAAIQAYVQNLGVENAGSDWTAKIGLLFIGANYDAINPTVLATKYSQFNEIEAGINTRTLTSAELISAGVKIEKTKKGKYHHTIPDMVQFTGDDAPLRVVKPTGIDLNSADLVYDLQFSDKGDGQYTLTVKPRNPQPVGDDILPNGSVESGIQEIKPVTKFRDSKEKDSKNQLATMLYNDVGHSKPELFGLLLSAIKTRDPAEIDKAIHKIETSGYQDLAKKLRSDKANYATWPTYMYGTQHDRGNEHPTQKQVNALRGQSVIKAENELAKKAEITAQSDENDFSISDKRTHTITQVSDEFPGQEMTVSVFATPTGGKHRIDAFDGSISMSSQFKDITTDYDYRVQIINATLNDSGKGGIRAQVDKLNQFLSGRGLTGSGTTNGHEQIVDLTQYVEFLKTGDIKKLEVPGLKPQDDKSLKIIEGRAMVAGNVCMNRMHAIIYPAFEFDANDRQLTTVASMDATAQLNASTVALEAGAIGLSVPGAAHRAHVSGNGSSGAPGSGSVTTAESGGGSGAGAIL